MVAFARKYWWAILAVVALVYYFGFHVKGKGFSFLYGNPDPANETQPGTTAVTYPVEETAQVTK